MLLKLLYMYGFIVILKKQCYERDDFADKSEGLQLR